LRVPCVTSEEWPDLYYGILDTHLGAIGRDRGHVQVEFEFPPDIGEVERVFLLCQYQLKRHAC
jgi:hypothetical protein